MLKLTRKFYKEWDNFQKQYPRSFDSNSLYNSGTLEDYDKYTAAHLFFKFDANNNMIGESGDDSQE